tara:strand:- start:100 stop:720 length:621 start_codon:yes stop_codon:yes gene_type:complete
MFLGPWDRGGDWSDSGINGVFRWLHRIWELCNFEFIEKDLSDEESKKLTQISNLTTKNVLEDMENFKYNTSIATLMEYSNYLSKIRFDCKVTKSEWTDSLKRLLIHLSPICPHISEELWQKLGHKNSIHLQINPTYDESLIEKSSFTLIVQINGKLRDQVELEKNISLEQIKKYIFESEKLKKYIDNKEIIKEIYIENKLINLVVR